MSGIGVGAAGQNKYGTIRAGQVPGTNTNDNAATGNAGEYVESFINGASGPALTSNTAVDIASISLTAGDWELTGLCRFVQSGAGALVVTRQALCLTTTSSTMQSAGTSGGNSQVDGLPGPTTNADMHIGIPGLRVTPSTTTTYFMVALATFTGATMAANGRISARRLR